MITPAMLITNLGLIVPVAEKDWAKTPIAERTQCVGTVAVGGSPSYMELLICLEMMRDSRKHQEDERAAKTRRPAGKTKRAGTRTQMLTARILPRVIGGPGGYSGVHPSLSFRRTIAIAVWFPYLRWFLFVILNLPATIAARAVLTIIYPATAITMWTHLHCQLLSII